MRFLRLANTAAAIQAQPYIGFANSLALDADGWALIPFGDSHHNAQDGRAAANSEIPAGLRKGVIQRFDRPSAESLVTDFQSLWKRVKRAVVGLPVFRGHPDAPRFANIFPDKAPRGTISDMEVTDAGLRIRPILTQGAAAEIDAGLSDFSPYWDLKLVNDADAATGLPVYSPFRLHSIGLVRRGNIPGLSLINADLSAMKALLIKLLAACGINVPAETADDAFGPFVQTALDKISGSATSAATEKAAMDEKLKAANASVTELTGQLTAANSKVTTLEGEKLTLANAKIAAEATIKTERLARAALLVDGAVSSGRVPAAERAAKVTSLANAADFEAEAAAIVNLKPTLKTKSSLTELSASGREQQSRQTSLLSLVNARMTETGETYDTAFTAVQNSDAGKAIVSGMKKPEPAAK